MMVKVDRSVQHLLVSDPLCNSARLPAVSVSSFLASLNSHLRFSHFVARYWPQVFPMVRRDDCSKDVKNPSMSRKLKNGILLACSLSGEGTFPGCGKRSQRHVLFSFAVCLPVHIGLSFFIAFQLFSSCTSCFRGFVLISSASGTTGFRA